MRLNELLGTDVVDADGKDLGRVHDVGLVQDGRVLGGFEAAFRAHWLLVGPGSLWSRLGIDRRSTHGPRLLTWLAARSEPPWRVPWNSIATIEPGRITLAVPVAELDRVAGVPPLRGGHPI